MSVIWMWKKEIKQSSFWLVSSRFQESWAVMENAPSPSFHLVHERRGYSFLFSTKLTVQEHQCLESAASTNTLEHGQWTSYGLRSTVCTLSFPQLEANTTPALQKLSGHTAWERVCFVLQHAKLPAVVPTWMSEASVTCKLTVHDQDQLLTPHSI